MGAHRKASGAGYYTTRAGFTQVVSSAGSFDNLYVDLDVAPGVGNSYTFTLEVNDIDTGLAVTISGNDTQNSDTTSEVILSPGDKVVMQITKSGSPATAQARWALNFNSSVVGETLLMSNQSGSYTDDYYYAIMGSTKASASSSGRTIVFPTSGTLKNLYIWSDVAPGEGNYLTFTVNKVGTGNTALSVPCRRSSTTRSDHPLVWAMNWG